jgi:TPR repeat protein
MNALGDLLMCGRGCVKNAQKALQMYKEAAHLGIYAEHSYGLYAFEDCDWERFLWWGRSLSLGHNVKSLCEAVFKLLPSFEGGGTLASCTW